MMTETTADYGWRGAAAAHTHDYLTPKVLEILAMAGARHVLDLGCGNGALCHTLQASGFDVAGVEPDLQGVQIARASCPHVRFYHQGVQDDPSDILAAEGKFFAVVSTEVVEPLYSPQLLPRFAAQVLPVGGHLVLTTPYHGYLKNLALSIAGKWDQHHTALWHGGHIKFWSRNTLTQLLAANGFDVVAFHGVGRVPLLWKSMVLVARRSDRANQWQEPSAA